MHSKYNSPIPPDTHSFLNHCHAMPIFRCVFLICLSSVSLVKADATISFNRDIRPILSENCFACHGFDPKHREEGLRLDTLDGATGDRDGVRAIVPGDLAQSELWTRIQSDDPDVL